MKAGTLTRRRPVYLNGEIATKRRSVKSSSLLPRVFTGSVPSPVSCASGYSLFDSLRPWGEAHDKLTTFQDAYKTHCAYIAREFPYLETEVTKQHQRYAMSRELNEKQLAEILASHSAALRAEATRPLDVFRI
jgi:hypothetical protein